MVYLDVITIERDRNNIIFVYIIFFSSNLSTLWIWSSEMRRSLQCSCLSLIQRCLAKKKKEGKINGGCFIIGEMLRGLLKIELFINFLSSYNLMLILMLIL